MANTCQIVAAKANDKASVALSSFIHALYELDSIALARLVTKDGKPPSLRVLAPNIEPDFECLIDIQVRRSISPLPFPILLVFSRRDCVSSFLFTLIDFWQLSSVSSACFQ